MTYFNVALGWNRTNIYVHVCLSIELRRLFFSTVSPCINRFTPQKKCFRKMCSTSNHLRFCSQQTIQIVSRFFCFSLDNSLIALEQTWAKRNLFVEFLFFCCLLVLILASMLSLMTEKIIGNVKHENIVNKDRTIWFMIEFVWSLLFSTRLSYFIRKLVVLILLTAWNDFRK